MPGAIIPKLTPEQEELDRKREELAAVRGALAERELELADFRAQLKSFEGRYLRQMGVLYAELDEWEARIAALEASLDTTPATQQHAEQARKQADESHEATHGEASQAKDFEPSADLRCLFREVAKRIHPDFAKNDADRHRRHDLMAQANDACNCGDAEPSLLVRHRSSIVQSRFHEDCCIFDDGGRPLIRTRAWRKTSSWPKTGGRQRPTPCENWVR